MKKILIIEDDTSIRELLLEIFECEGYVVDASVNGSEGIKSLHTNIPDIILMDVMMPIMDGYEFRREQLKNPAWQSIPVIAMSAQDQRDEKLLNHGITHFISKPLELDQLLDTVKILASA